MNQFPDSIGGEQIMPDKAGKLPREEAYKDLLNLLHEISSTITNRLDFYDLIRSMVMGL